MTADVVMERTGPRPPAAATRRQGHAAGRRRALPASVYRRRRLVAAVLLLGPALVVRAGLGVLGGEPLTASEAGSPEVRLLTAEPASSRTYVVEAGDTLWSIARRAVPEGDVRPVVDALARARGGRPLQAGERVQVPVLAVPGRSGHGSGG